MRTIQSLNRFQYRRQWVRCWLWSVHENNVFITGTRVVLNAVLSCIRNRRNFLKLLILMRYFFLMKSISDVQSQPFPARDKNRLKISDEWIQVCCKFNSHDTHKTGMFERKSSTTNGSRTSRVNARSVGKKFQFEKIVRTIIALSEKNQET